MYCIRPLIQINKDNKQFYAKYEQQFFSWKHFPEKNKLNLYLKNKLVFAYPCGNCLRCINMKRFHWVKKLELEKQFWKHTLFLTLTYNQQNYPGQLKTSDIQNFIKYLRQSDKNIKYFCCGEYGGKTERAHYHLILFTNKDYQLDFIKQTKNGPLFDCKDFNKCWLNKGFIWVAHDLNSASFAYVATYSNKNYLKQIQNRKYKHFLYNVQLLKTQPEFLHLSNWQKYLYIDNYLIPTILFRKNEFLLMSKKPPIGSGYKKINKNVPSSLLKWKKKTAVSMADYDKYFNELNKRQNDYHIYLQNNDIQNIIYDNNILFEKNVKKKLKTVI